MVKVGVYAPEILPLSLCDYLGEPACVIFFSGCNFNCGYCYNWRLKPQPQDHPVDLEVIKSKIRSNALITACKVTGGEPLLQAEALLELGTFVRSLKLKFGIDTNGSLPDPLRRILPVLDLVSLDIKTALNEAEYGKITGSTTLAAHRGKRETKGSRCVEAVKESLDVVLSSTVYADLRMVVIPGYNDSQEIIASVANHLRQAGYERKASQKTATFTLVEFVPENAWLEEFRRLKNTSAESLLSLARSSGLENVRVTHRAVGFCKEL